MLNRTKAPAFSQNFSFELPQPEIISLGNGSRLIWLNGIQQDVFKIELVFESGNETRCVVKFAPYQKLPKERKKPDPRQGSIETGKMN